LISGATNAGDVTRHTSQPQHLTHNTSFSAPSGFQTPLLADGDSVDAADHNAACSLLEMGAMVCEMPILPSRSDFLQVTTIFSSFTKNVILSFESFVSQERCKRNRSNYCWQCERTGGLLQVLRHMIPRFGFVLFLCNNNFLVAVLFQCDMRSQIPSTVLWPGIYCFDLAGLSPLQQIALESAIESSVHSLHCRFVQQ
jgi:hypothetical protein